MTMSRLWWGGYQDRDGWIRIQPPAHCGNSMTIDEHEYRIRRQLIQESLRKLAMDRELPLDEFYSEGDLNEWQWRAGHIFREERIFMLEAREKGRERDPKTGRIRGFNMASVGIERAMRLEWHLPPQYLEWACGLIGERMICVEKMQAQRVTVALAEFYNIRPPLRWSLERTG